MKTRTLLAAATLALLPTLVQPAFAVAQEEEGGWRARLSIQGGAYIPLQELGNTPVALPVDRRFTFKGDVQPAPMIVGALEVTTPLSPARVRLNFRSTVGGTVEGQIAECILADDDPDGDCAVAEADAVVRDLTLGLLLIREPSPDRLIRPYITAALGLRQWEFAERGCDDFPCFDLERVTTDQTKAVFEAALGVRYALGPVMLDLALTNSVAGYESDDVDEAGMRNVQSEVQTNLLVAFGGTVSIF